MTDNIDAVGAKAPGPTPGLALDGSGVGFRGPLGVLFCFCAFTASMALALLGGLLSCLAFSLIGAYGVLFFGVGAAPLQLLSRLDVYARLTGAALIGFSVLLIGGALMIDIQSTWHPALFAVLVYSTAAGFHIAGLHRAWPVIVLWLRRRAAVSRLARVGTPPVVRASILLILAGSLLWLGPALATRDADPGIGGLLVTIGPLWYLGLVLVLVGFALGRSVERCACLATFSFGLATTLTPALVYGTPRNATAGKQMQLTLYALADHHIDVTSGIYQAYSALFGGMAWFCQVLGIHGMYGSYSLLGVATYWPVLLVFIRIVELRLLAGRLLRTTGRRWVAVILVLLVDSLGDDYFSPQSVGYVLAIGAVAIAMNGLYRRPFSRRGTFWLLATVGVALAPTHELSPYVAAGALFILAIFGEAPWWACLPLGVPALAWVGVVHNAVGHSFSFAFLFDVQNFSPPTTIAAPGLSRLPIVGLQSHALLAALLILIALGAIGFLSNFRRRWAWGYGLCPAVGLGFIAVNPYGNEGIFRATLFAIPWIAILAMRMPPPSSMLGVLVKPVEFTTAVVVCLLTFLGTFVIAAYGMDGTDVLRRSDLVVNNYLMKLPPQNAFVLCIGPASNPVGGLPFTIDYSALDWSDVATVQALSIERPTPISLVALADRYGAIAAENSVGGHVGPLYVVWSRSVVESARVYGLVSPRTMNAWLHLLKTSPNWEIADHYGGTYLFRLTRH